LLFLDGDNLVAPGCITAHAKAHALLPNLIGRGETRHLRNTRFLLDPETGTPMPGQESRIARTPPAELDRMKVSTQQVLEDFASIERRSELGIYPGIGPRKLYELEIDALKRQQPQQLLWMTASGCNMSVRRNAFLAIGGFNPQVDLTEQREMAARLCAMGQVMGFVEGGVTYHLSHRSGWRDPLQDTQWEQHLLQTQPGAATRLLPVMWASLADHSPLPTTQRITNLDATSTFSTAAVGESVRVAVTTLNPAQIGGGGASLNVNSLIAGNVSVGVSTISTVTGSTLTINATANFRGGVTGYPLAWSYFFY
jgi:hypothetical protein